MVEWTNKQIFSNAGKLLIVNVSFTSGAWLSSLKEEPQQGSAEFPTDRFIPFDLNDVQPTTSVGPSYPKWENWSAKKKSKKRTIDSPPRGTKETLGQGSAESSAKEVVPFELNVTQPTPSTELSISDWKVLSTKKSKSTLVSSQDSEYDLATLALTSTLRNFPVEFLSPPFSTSLHCSCATCLSAARRKTKDQI